jgi:hypothetical protein
MFTDCDKLYILCHVGKQLAVYVPSIQHTGVADINSDQSKVKNNSAKIDMGT